MSAQVKGRLESFYATTPEQLYSYLDRLADGNEQTRLLSETSQLFDGLTLAQLKDLSCIAEERGFFDAANDDKLKSS